MTKKGFTVLELLIAVSVIGILAIISVPIYKNIIPSFVLNSAIRETATDLRYAQQLAVTEQIIHSVIFDKITNSYSVKKGEDILLTKKLNNNIKLSDINGFSSNTINFISTGAVIEPGNIVLTSKEKNSTIEIKPSGYVRIQ